MKEESSFKPLRFAIIGAGGIGCYYGIRLQEAGHQITFIARGKHLTVLQEKGLTLEHPSFSYKGEVNASSLESLIINQKPSDFDALLICVKATATKSIADSLKKWFKQASQKTAVISLQNGIDNEQQLAESLGNDCIIGGLAVRIGGHIVSTGHVKATGIAQIIMGAWPTSNSPVGETYHQQLKLWESAFNQAKIPTQVVSDINRELWRKLVINNGVNPLSALTRLDTKTMCYHYYFGGIVLGLMREASQVAIADNIKLTDDDAQEMYQLIRDFDAIKTSMLVDLEKGSELEVDAISGAVIQRAKKLGVEVPYTQMVYALLKEVSNSIKET